LAGEGVETVIIGGGQAGLVMSHMLWKRGRQVYISVGRHRRFPRRYRGKDVIWWLERLGIDGTPDA